jgi:EmrB/QacA subfamily drug resistance transporter
MGLTRTPCDAIATGASESSPCAPSSGPWVLAATILGSSMAFIDGTVVNVAIPTLQRTFQASIVDVQWVVESYGLLLSSLILAGGAIGDLLGRRLVFLTGVAIFAAASAGCGLAPSIHFLVIARAIQGVGAALLIPGSLAIIAASFEESVRGKAIGTWSGFTAITTALGPVLGGWLIEHGSWRWAFFLNVPLAAAVLLISLVHVPESRGARPRTLDGAGALLATLGLAGLVTGFLESMRLGWSNIAVEGSLFGGAACLIAFLVAEGHARSPMVPLSLFKAKAFVGANLVTLFLYAAISVFFFLFPMKLIRLEGYSATAAGAAATPMILCMFVLSRWAGGLVSELGGKMPLMIGPALVALGFVLFALFPTSSAYWKTLFPVFLVLGLGMTVTVAPLTTVVMGSVGEDLTGAASGINNAVARVAGVLAIAVFGIVMVDIFGGQLQRNLPRLGLTQDVVRQVESKKLELAELEPPQEWDAWKKDEFRRATAEAFRQGLRRVLLCCAGLSILSSMIAACLVPAKAHEERRSTAASGGSVAAE